MPVDGSAMRGPRVIADPITGRGRYDGTACYL